MREGSGVGGGCENFNAKKSSHRNIKYIYFQSVSEIYFLKLQDPKNFHFKIGKNLLKANTAIKFYYCCQGLIKAVFDIGFPILGTLIWACLILILSKTETAIKRNSSFLIKSST